MWNTKLFWIEDFGREKLDIPDYPNRGLFYAVLRIKGSNYKPAIFVSTVHLPWQGCKDEISTGINPRINITNQIIKFLAEKEYEGYGNRRNSFNPIPIILGGDFNEDFHPIRILSENNYMR